MSHKEFAEMYTSGSAASEYANNKINQIATDLLALLSIKKLFLVFNSNPTDQTIY